jgi:hypothetical protein
MQLYDAPSPIAQSPNARKRPVDSIPKPTSLCRWTIHIRDEECLDEENYVPLQESTNGDWPEDWLNTPFEQKLQEGLEGNVFSSVDATSLPIHISDVAAAVQRSPEEMFKQSLAFAIMGRSILLVQQLLDRACEEKREFADIHPFHLAATYLDGSRSCCDILQLLKQTTDDLDFRPNSIGPMD